MRPFWLIIGVVLFAALIVWPWFVAEHTPRGDYHASNQVHEYLIAYPLTIALLSVVWAIANRPQLERGHMSLAAIFALVTLLAVGLCFARLMLSLSVS
jgi:type VI protein secretion system component VasK